MNAEDDNVALIFSIVKDSLVSQRDQRSSLETKASALSAFAGAMFALLFGARQSLLVLTGTSLTLVYFSLGLFVLSVIGNRHHLGVEVPRRPGPGQPG